MADITVIELWEQIMANASFLYPTRDDFQIVVSTPSDTEWNAYLIGDTRFTESNSFVAVTGTSATSIVEAYKNLLFHVSDKVMRCLAQKLDEESGSDHAESGLNHAVNGLNHAVNGLDNAENGSDHVQ